MESDKTTRAIGWSRPGQQHFLQATIRCRIVCTSGLWQGEAEKLWAVQLDTRVRDSASWAVHCGFENRCQGAINWLKETRHWRLGKTRALDQRFPASSFRFTGRISHLFICHVTTATWLKTRQQMLTFYQSWSNSSLLASRQSQLAA